ncbi:MAG: hypothetical protein H8D45_31370 [Bacteroidetes bacterium]|nr:hypothetical protein [Bacteroidota bacterium]
MTDLELIIYSLTWVLNGAGALWMYESKSFKFSIDHQHHYYFGWVCVGFAWLLYCLDRPLWLVLTLAMAGLWAVIDDMYQHHKQVKYPNYYSPLHKMNPLYWIW